MKKIYVSQITEHFAKEIAEEFLLKDIRLEYTKDSVIPYLQLKLEDKSGTLFGRIWEHNIEDEYLSYKGKVVKAYGEVTLNSSSPEFICFRMELVADAEMSCFIKGITEEETEKYLITLKKQMSLVKNEGLHELLTEVFNGEMNRFKEAPASLNLSGSYNGGLLVQTVSVTSMALQLMRSHKLYSYQPDLKIELDEELLICGALLFGIGVSHLFTPYPKAERVGEYSLIPKEVLSIQIIEKYVSKMQTFVSIEKKNLIYHMIQTVYERDTAGIMTREALLLNMAYHAYKRLSDQECLLTKIQDKTGPVYIQNKNHYLYVTKQEIKGGAGNELESNSK